MNEFVYLGVCVLFTRNGKCMEYLERSVKEGNNVVNGAQQKWRKSTIYKDQFIEINNEFYLNCEQSDNV